MEGTMIDIKVAGPGCKNCDALESVVKKVVEELEVEATLVKITDFNEMAEIGVLMTPGLVINGKLLSQGKVPSESQIKEWLSKAAGR